MSGIVIVGFGGVGKTELAKKYKNVIDLESIFWKWHYSEDINKNVEYFKSYQNRIPNSNFPQNYIEAIKENLKKYDIVLVAYSDIICKSLRKNKIDFFLCYPDKKAKDIYIERFRKRGNNNSFINKNIELFEKAVNIAEKMQEQKMILYGNETLEEYLISNGYKLISK